MQWLQLKVVREDRWGRGVGRKRLRDVCGNGGVAPQGGPGLQGVICGRDQVAHPRRAGPSHGPCSPHHHPSHRSCSPQPPPAVPDTFLHYRTSKVRALRAAPLERLLRELVSGDREQDPGFVPAFLATHRAFVPTGRVLRFLLPPPPPPPPPGSVGVDALLGTRPSRRTRVLSSPGAPGLVPTCLLTGGVGLSNRLDLKRLRGQDLGCNKNLRLAPRALEVSGERGGPQRRGGPPSP